MERIMIKPRTTNIGMTPTGMRSGQILHSEGGPMRSVRESLLLKNGKKIYFAGLITLCLVPVPATAIPCVSISESKYLGYLGNSVYYTAPF
jgi:hypothetical protein